MQVDDKFFLDRVVQKVSMTMPDKTAIVWGKNTLTYRQLETSIASLSTALSPHINGNKIVATFMGPQSDLVISLLSIFRKGCVYLPLDPMSAVEKNNQILRDCTPAVVITSDKYFSTLLDFIAVFKLDIPTLVKLADNISVYKQDKNLKYSELDVSCSNESTSAPDESLKGESPNYIYYTSGTTGAGKAILGCHKSLSHFIHWQIRQFSIDASCRVGMLAQITFDASLRDIFVPLCIGGTLYIPDEGTKYNFSQLIPWMQTQQINIVHTVPSVFRLIIKELHHFPDALTTLSHIFLAGEPLFAKDALEWRKLSGNQVSKIVNLYGTSESTLAKTFYVVNYDTLLPDAVFPVGKPISNTAVAIFQGNVPCLDSEIGEVYIRTPFRTLGYLNNVEMTADLFVCNPYTSDPGDRLVRTGDYGRFLPDGNLEILGRNDDQIKVNGVRIELAEVKVAMMQMPEVKEAEIVVFKTDGYENRIAAYYTGTALSTNELRDRLGKILNAYALPTWFVHMNEFPLTINGKVNKKNLPNPSLQQLGSGKDSARLSCRQKEIADIWGNALNVEGIGPAVSFFELGGTSLKVLEVISAIFKKYGVLIKFKDFFSNSTVEKIDRLISQLSPEQLPDMRYAGTDQKVFALSPSQLGIWISSTLDKSKIAYNIPTCFKLKGRLDMQAFKLAWQKLIMRHDSLRTVIVIREAQPFQRVLNHDELNWTMQEWDARTASSTDEFEFIDKACNHIFDLEQGPLFLLAICRKAKDEFLFISNFHHIIIDGWSMEVLFTDLFEIYNALVAGREPQIAPPKLQYRDYVTWHDGHHDRVQALSDQEFWLSKLDGAAPLPLAIDKALSQAPNEIGQTLVFFIEKTQYHRVRKITQENRVTMFNLLFTLSASYLYVLSGQKDITIGVPYLGRTHPDLNATIGCFINMIPIRLTFEAGMSFQQFLLQTGHSLTESFDHAAYPYTRMVEDLGRINGRSDQFFNVVVQIQDAIPEGSEKRTIPGIEIEKWDTAYRGSKFDLTFNFIERKESERIECSFEFKCSLFSEATVQRYINEFMVLLKHALEQPAQTLFDLKKRVHETRDDSKVVSTLLDQFVK